MIPETVDEIRKVASMSFVDFAGTPTKVLVAEYDEAEVMFKNVGDLYDDAKFTDRTDPLERVLYYVDHIKQAMHQALFERYADRYYLKHAIEAGIVDEYDIQHENKHFDEWIEGFRNNEKT